VFRPQHIDPDVGSLAHSLTEYATPAEAVWDSLRKRRPRTDRDVCETENRACALPLWKIWLTVEPHITHDHAEETRTAVWNAGIMVCTRTDPRSRLCYGRQNSMRSTSLRHW